MTHDRQASARWLVRPAHLGFDPVLARSELGGDTSEARHDSLRHRGHKLLKQTKEGRFEGYVAGRGWV